MITLTDNAIHQIRKLVLSRKNKPLGIKLDIETKVAQVLPTNLNTSIIHQKKMK